jgi:hypothetical protein
LASGGRGWIQFEIAAVLAPVSTSRLPEMLIRRLFFAVDLVTRGSFHRRQGNDEPGSILALL